MKVKDSYNVTRLSIAAATAALEDYALDAGQCRAHPRDARAPDRRPARAGFTVPAEPRELRPGAAPGGDQLEASIEALKARGILVRYFATPELFDALRITVGTDAEIDALLGSAAGDPRA